MSGKVDIKVVALGQHCVGKTSVIQRFLCDKFTFNVDATVGAAFVAKKINVDGKDVTLGIWDTAGAERYESMSRIYYRSAKIVLLVYDLTNKVSFQKVQYWMEELKWNEPDAIRVIVESKVDCIEEGAERELSLEYVKNYAELNESLLFQVSAKTGVGIEEMFHAAAVEWVNKAKKVQNHRVGKSKFKVIVLGVAAAGKTSLLQRALSNTFVRTQATVQLADMMVMNFPRDVTLEIWDTCGEERWMAQIKAYYRNVHCAILVYDATARRSFDKLDLYINQFQEQQV
eukprot:TRINITY_DN3365_c0_g1_i1.p1 TRINITY_DN3365_c0_g1~~TRINITY_DN3365_c0_g1_i1.p1  ORF type:complete len:286 (+),score=48.03 TRINITY_DN3365_c0_g1_i1:93-950(+)